MAEEAEEVVVESSGSSGGGTSKLVMILSLLNLLVTLGIVGVLYMQFSKEASSPSPSDISAEGEVQAEGKDGEAQAINLHEATKMLALDQFTVNLNTTGSQKPKFARVSISLEIPSVDTEEEVAQKMPQVRNVIIDLFNSRRPNDLANPEGRNYLKEEIKNSVNGFLVTGKIKGVFFTNFALSS